MLPSAADAEQAAVIMQRFASRMSVIAHAYCRSEFGASIGVASASGAGTSAESLMREADAATYEAKAPGKNRLVSRAAAPPRRRPTVAKRRSVIRECDAALEQQT